MVRYLGQWRSSARLLLLLLRDAEDNDDADVGTPLSLVWLLPNRPLCISLKRERCDCDTNLKHDTMPRLPALCNYRLDDVNTVCTKSFLIRLTRPK